MKSFWLKALIRIVKMLMDSDLFEMIKGLVQSFMNEDIPGPMKKALVEDSVQDFIQESKETGLEISKSLLNLAIESLVVYYKR